MSVLFFETGLHCVALAGSELPAYIDQAGLELENSEVACLCFPTDGIKDVGFGSPSRPLLIAMVILLLPSYTFFSLALHADRSVFLDFFFFCRVPSPFSLPHATFPPCFCSVFSLPSSFHGS